MNIINLRGNLRALGPQYGVYVPAESHSSDQGLIVGDTNIVVQTHTTPLMPNLPPEVMFYCCNLPSSVASYETNFPRSLYELTSSQLPANIQIITAIKQPSFTVFKNFLTLVESQALIGQMQQRLEKLNIRNNNQAQAMVFSGNEFELLSNINKRIAELSNTKVEQGEELYIYRYPANVSLEQHCDFISADIENYSELTAKEAGGQRIASLIICLNSIEQGGEFDFPVIGGILSPHHGNAGFISYAYPDGLEIAFDRRSLYSKRASTYETQWYAVKYIRQTNITAIKHRTYPQVEIIN